MKNFSINLNALDNKKILVILLLSVMSLSVDYNFFIRAQLEGVKSLDQKIKRLKEDTVKVNRDAALLKKKQAETAQGVILKVKKMISKGEIPLLLQEMNSIANKNNVRITQIKPSAEVVTKDQKQAKDSGNFTSILITLDVSCDYHGLGKFLNNLENADYFFAVQEMRITEDPNNYFYQNANLVLKSYVRK